MVFGASVFFLRLTPGNAVNISRFVWRRYVLDQPVPVSVVIAVTDDCQCNCVHCSVGDYARRADPLTTEEVKATLDYVQKWGPIG